MLGHAEWEVLGLDCVLNFTDGDRARGVPGEELTEAATGRAEDGFYAQMAKER